MVIKRYPRATKIIASLATILMIIPALCGCITTDNHNNNSGNEINPFVKYGKEIGLDEALSQEFQNVTQNTTEYYNFIDYLVKLNTSSATHLAQSLLEDNILSTAENNQIKFLSSLDYIPSKDKLVNKNWDYDGFSNRFEQLFPELYDVKIPNDRFVILVGSYWNSNNPNYSKYMYNFQYNFFNKILKIPSENIINLVNQNATFENFINACNNISKKADNNDFIYLIFEAKASYQGITFHKGELLEGRTYTEIDSQINKINSKVKYIQVGTCYAGLAIDFMKKESSKRIIITEVSREELSGSFLGSLTFYPTILTKKADTDKNNFVSCKETYSFSSYIFETKYNNNYHPQLSDLSNISEKFYLGEIKADKTLKESEGIIFDWDIILP